VCNVSNPPISEQPRWTSILLKHLARRKTVELVQLFYRHRGPLLKRRRCSPRDIIQRRRKSMTPERLQLSVERIQSVYSGDVVMDFAENTAARPPQLPSIVFARCNLVSPELVTFRLINRLPPSPPTPSCLARTASACSAFQLSSIVGQHRGIQRQNMTFSFFSLCFNFTTGSFRSRRSAIASRYSVANSSASLRAGSIVLG